MQVREEEDAKLTRKLQLHLKKRRQQRKSFQVSSFMSAFFLQNGFWLAGTCLNVKGKNKIWEDIFQPPVGVIT